MEVTRQEFHEHIRENDAAFADLRGDVRLLASTLGEIKVDVKSLLHKSPRGNGNPPPKTEAHQRLQYDLIRMLVGALLALAGVGAQRSLAG